MRLEGKGVIQNYRDIAGALTRVLYPQEGSPPPPHTL